MSGIYINYGCGLSAPQNWLNFDASPRLRLERTPIIKQLVRAKYGLLFPPTVVFGDVRKRLPVETGTADCVFCSHVLEHLSSADVDEALRETFRILSPGGIFRLVVPDLQVRAISYVKAAADEDPEASNRFLQSTLLGIETRPTSFGGMIRDLLGNNAHRWMFDFAGMRARLLMAGFIEVRRCTFGDAKHPAFQDVEERERFFDNDMPELAIECCKADENR
jgi:SAM-dependent methyltransferase